MTTKRFIAVRDETCLDCGFCSQFVMCSLNRTGCIGCGACIKGCTQKAISLEMRKDLGEKIRFTVDGKEYIAEGPVSVAQALYEIGHITPDNVLENAAAGIDKPVGAVYVGLDNAGAL